MASEQVYDSLREWERKIDSMMYERRKPDLFGLYYVPTPFRSCDVYLELMILGNEESPHLS